MKVEVNGRYVFVGAGVIRVCMIYCERVLCIGAVRISGREGGRWFWENGVKNANHPVGSSLILGRCLLKLLSRVGNLILWNFFGVAGAYCVEGALRVAGELCVRAVLICSVYICVCL